MKLYTLIVSALLLSTTMAGSAQGAPIKNEPEKPNYAPITSNQFKALLSGQTIVGEYRLMRERTKTFGFSEAHHDDGTTDYAEGPVRSKGVWYTLSTNKICYKYPDDPDMGTGISCFWVYKDEGCYYSFGIGAMTLKGPRRFEDWSARWIIKGDGGSCDAPIS